MAKTIKELKIENRDTIIWSVMFALREDQITIEEAFNAIDHIVKEAVIDAETIESI